ncbi:MAG: amino acid permease, partial [Actinomycetes bacterium]
MKQQLSLGSAVAIGLASMIGAGVFVVFREATALAGDYLWLAFALAALVASLNAASVYQLASVNERAGGVYAYSRVYINDYWSFIAGFAFVFGKIGSISAIALVFAEYLSPMPKSLTASIAIVILALVNVLGINRTAGVALVLAIITTIYLALAATLGIGHGLAHLGTASNPEPNPFTLSIPGQIGGVLPASAVLFFAFAGYARVAT